MTDILEGTEYPRPQFKRKGWQNLNGEWDFAFDDKNIGEEEDWYKRNELERKINVPYTFESEASGIADRTPHPYVWYQREVDLKERNNKRTILHFNASDYITKVWIDGKFVGEHKGGYDSFSFDISNYLSEREKVNLVVKIEDTMSKIQARGKQSWKKDNFSCWYTRTTGIWQTVWLEFVDKDIYIENVKTAADIDNNEVEFVYNFNKNNFQDDYRIETEISFEDKKVKSFSFDIDEKQSSYKVNLESDNLEVKLWSPDEANLYEVEYTVYKNNKIVDQVSSYFGMRKISVENGQILLNNQRIYQKLILDQGYWPETVLTPPDAEAIKEDLQLIKEMGFNGVRKHQKIEDPRFYHLADKMGLLVWAEMGSSYKFNDQAADDFTKQWLNIVQQLYNHPSIITWVPFNESWGIENIKTDNKQQSFTEAIYHLTKSIDPERPVIANDGWEHTISDIITFHDYEEKGEKLAPVYRDNKDALMDNKASFNIGKFIMADGYNYDNQPIILSEFGGIAFQDEEGWGYGEQVDSEEELIERMNSLMEEIKKIEYFQGYCYTQLTDVEQEKNGLLTDKRKYKIPLEQIIEFNEIIEYSNIIF